MGTDSYKYSADLDESLAIGQAIVDRLDQLEYDHGKRLKKDAVFACWAEPDDISDRPSIAVIMSDEFSFDESQFVPTEIDSSKSSASGDGWMLWQDCEFVTSVQIMIYCTDPVQRALVTRAVREALQDKDAGHYGAWLPLKRYFGGFSNVIVTLRSGRYVDGSSEAEIRDRKAILTCNCQMPVFRAEQYKTMDLRVSISTSTDVLEVVDEAD